MPDAGQRRLFVFGPVALLNLGGVMERKIYVKRLKRRLGRHCNNLLSIIEVDNAQFYNV